MALEQFRTQVLLLHSQQSTLDALGAGFNDRYSVHFATSGAEALTTLGETPINIFVSAQDLPGMSGLEALREAKKRSPDTIGILLAGDDSDDSLEALVGDQEVFQVVRGSVEPEAIQKIVENASRKMRMLTLEKSANDTAANVDVPVDSSQAEADDEGEHIVMETADNGTTIISDGTGRMPALKPEKIGANADTQGRTVDVLVLTKDSDFLETIRESARGLHNVHHAVTGQQALDAVNNHSVGVLVTDAAVAGNKVELLTRKLRSGAPRLVAIVAGRRDDGDMLMGLINRGQVYRFLLKPVSPGRARLAVEASVKHHLEADNSAFGQGATATPGKIDTATATPATPATPKPEPAAPVPEAPLVDAKTGAEPSLNETGSLRESARLMAAQVAAKSASKRKGGLPLPLIAAGVAVVLLIGAGAWYFTGSDAGDPAAVADDLPAATGNQPAQAVVDTQAPAEPAGQAAAPVAPAPEPAYVKLLDNARFARDSGRILAPSGDNAIEWYAAAREAAPDNAAIAEELDALVDQVLGMAETALLEGRAGDAEAALQMAAVANPGNSRLAFLNAQLDQMQLRALLDDARVAVREARFEDAGALLATAGEFPGSNDAAIGQVAEELAAARSAQQIDEVIAQANDRLAAGNLVEPANDNARYFFELALSNDPRNTAARQGLLVVASRLALQARAAIDAGELENAGYYLDDARALDPESSELQAADTALQAALERRAEAERLAAAAREAASREAAARRAAEERRRNAATATLSTGEAPELEAPDREAPDLESPVASFARPGVADTGEYAGEPADEEALETFLPAAADAATVPAAMQTGPDTQAAPDLSGGQAELPVPQTIAVSQLTRLNYVAPKYPRLAQRRGTSGWVDIEFTVLPSGNVGEIDVVDSSPGTIFDDAATDAVSQWRFEPIVENGRQISKRVAVRMSFSLQ